MWKSFIVQLIQYRGLKLVLKFSIPKTSVEKAMCELLRGPQDSILSYHRCLEGAIGKREPWSSLQINDFHTRSFFWS